MADMGRRDPVAILAAGGRMPRLVADAISATGRPVVLAALSGFFDGEAGPHDMFVLSPGQFSLLFSRLRQRGCRDIVMVGEMKRPRLRDLRIDWGGVKRLPLLFKVRGRGDDSAMRLLTETFEREGFNVVSLSDVAPGLAAPIGPVGRLLPNVKQTDSIAFGFELLGALSPFDVGQAAILHGRRVLAVEGAEGTAAMIERIAALRRSGRFSQTPPSGILVKSPKASQELRNDMPVVGAATLQAASEAGLAGIAVAAGGVALAESAEMARLADQYGLFVVGCDREGRWTNG